MQKQKHHHNKPHLPVLLEDVLGVLDPKEGESYLDLAVGYAGHARAVIDQTKAAHRAVLVDRDQNALDSVIDLKEQGATLIKSDFASALQELEGKQLFDMILIDLGVSSPHLDDARRGFSFQQDGPLDMRMDQQQERSADYYVNHIPKHELSELIKRYGEEKKAKAIASAIVRSRPIRGTSHLADVIEKTIGRGGQKIHPATRTFQAIRIAVNDELNQIEQSLTYLPDLMANNGRLAVISFHSLEDRLVKQFFKENGQSKYESHIKTLTKKPIQGTNEDVHNPRARSAKLRAGVKINI